MKFFVSSRLQYQISGPSTLLCSLSCIHSAGQSVLQEKLCTSRTVEREDLSFGMEENRFTKLDVAKQGDLEVSYDATVQIKPNTHDASHLDSQSVRQMSVSVLPYLCLSGCNCVHLYNAEDWLRRRNNFLPWKSTSIMMAPTRWSCCASIA